MEGNQGTQEYLTFASNDYIRSRVLKIIVGAAKDEFWMHVGVLANFESEPLKAVLRKARDGVLEWPDVDVHTFTIFMDFAYRNDFRSPEPPPPPLAIRDGEERVRDDDEPDEETATSGEQLWDRASYLLCAPCDREAQTRTDNTGSSLRPPFPKSKLRFTIPECWTPQQCGVRFFHHEPRGNYAFVRSLPMQWAHRRHRLMAKWMRWAALFGVEARETTLLSDGEYWARSLRPSTSYRDVFEKYVRLCFFANKYGIRRLHGLALRKLWSQLSVWVLYPDRIGDLVFLASIIYENTGINIESKLLRHCVVSYAGAFYYDLAGHRVWDQLLHEGGVFIRDTGKYVMSV